MISFSEKKIGGLVALYRYQNVRKNISRLKLPRISLRKADAVPVVASRANPK